MSDVARGPEDPEVPEADALDQQREVSPSIEGAEGAAAGGRPATEDPEVPEADALEQAQEVPTPDE
ncbi:MAG TPA: hypothetical protein VFW63_05700 [Acidimicrobiales bacterium]|nr:hypothetical protein [Acidimicrobiales bacterium]